jgi:hypothetical protein
MSDKEKTTYFDDVRTGAFLDYQEALDNEAQILTLDEAEEALGFSLTGVKDEYV